MFEIDADALAPLPSRDNRFDPIESYPQADVDISLLFDVATPWQAIAAAAGASGGEVHEVAFVDDYRGKGVPEGRKSITLRLRIGVPGRTLRSEEINAVGDRARAALRQRLGAEERPA
jgi:phenylalanyl-tRNA synthetase beta chain